MTKSADAYDSPNFICLHLRSSRKETLISQKLALSPSNLNLTSTPPPPHRNACMECRRLPIQLRGRLLSSWMPKTEDSNNAGLILPLAMYPVWINLLKLSLLSDNIMAPWFPDGNFSAISESSRRETLPSRRICSFRLGLHSKNYDLETLIIWRNCFPTNSISP